MTANRLVFTKVGIVVFILAAGFACHKAVETPLGEVIKVDRADTAPTSSTPSGTIDAEAGTHFWLVRIDTSHTAKKPDLLSLGEKSILIDDAGARHPLFTFTSSYSNAGISDYALIFSLSDARKPAALEVASAGTFALPREQAQ